MYCNKCGNFIANDSTFCPKCGQRVSGTAQEPTTTDKVQGGLQAITLIVAIIMIIIGSSALLGGC
jgi:uncharacterized membrane protein YvbJ